MKAPRSMSRTRRRSQILCTSGVVLLLTFAAPAGAALSLEKGTSAPFFSADPVYPDWNDVAAAKQNETAKAAEINRINSLLSGLETRAGKLGDEAVLRGVESAQAAASRDAAARFAETVQNQARAAEQDAADAKRLMAQIALELSRSGGNLTEKLLASGQKSDGLLYRLGVLSEITHRSARLNDIAITAENVSRALRDQANIAATQRDELAQAAEQALQNVQAIEAETARQLAEQKNRSTVLYQQLASLKGSTAQVEERYRAGVAAAEAYAAQQRAAEEEAKKQNPRNPPQPPDSGPVPTSGPPVDIPAAKAYAREQVSARGWSASEFQCLDQLFHRESSWRYTATNPSSQAYGIPQALPGHKMSSAGSDWRTNYKTQINWGISYIENRYDTPCGAWEHSEKTNWY